MRRFREMTRKVLNLTMVIVLMLAYCAMSAEAESVGYTVSGRFYQTDARGALASINAFRLSEDAWYWNEDNQTKTELPNLCALAYDYDLEQIAMQRAAEIAIYFSHTRPDGSKCFTCTYNGTRSYGENIAAGYGNSEKAYVAFREDNDDYKGQGHRRNMLEEGFTAVGLAHFEYRGQHFYVQEFGYSHSGAAQTTACDSDKTMTVAMKSEEQKLVANFQYSGYDAPVSCEVELVNPKIGMSSGDSFSSGIEIAASECKIEWKSDKPDVVRIDGTKFISVAPGTAKITATVTYNGMTASCSMTVTVPQLQLEDLWIANLPEVEYEGKPCKLNLNLSIYGCPITEGKDYTITYTNNTKAGTASFVINGVSGGKCTGSYSGTFTVVDNVPNPPVVEETPEPTKAPEPTKTPEPTKAPEPTNTPVPTKAPQPTNTPVPTKAPEPTNTPVPTKAPQPTNTPVPTKAPQPTNTPVPTKAPQPTNTPVPTKAPQPTNTPVPTKAPQPTNTPVPTKAPQPTNTPVPTKAPEPTNDPVHTEEPEPVDTTVTDETEETTETIDTTETVDLTETIDTTETTDTTETEEQADTAENAKPEEDTNPEDDADPEDAMTPAEEFADDLVSDLEIPSAEITVTKAINRARDSRKADSATTSLSAQQEEERFKLILLTIGTLIPCGALGVAVFLRRR